MNISSSTVNNWDLDSTLIDSLLKINGGKKNDTRTSVPMPTSEVLAGCTRTEPEMSEADYKNAIVAQAQAKANGLENHNAFMDLKNSFRSAYAPDRATLISNAIRKMSQNQSSKESVSSLEFSDEFGNIFNNAYHAALSAQKKLDMSV